MITKSDQEDDSNRGNEVYDDLVEMSGKHNEEKWQQLVDKYEKDRLNMIEAKEKSNKKLRNDYLNEHEHSR